MERPIDRLADVLASITEAEQALQMHMPATCSACAEVRASRSYIVCGQERDWTAYLAEMLDTARPLVASFLSEDPGSFNEDEDDLLKAAAPMLDAYRRLMEHTCPECRGGFACPHLTEMRAEARAASMPVQRYGSRILART